MNKLLLENLIRWPKSYITGTDLRIILDKTKDSRKGIIKRTIKEGYLERLKENIFLIQKIPNKPLPDRFELAEIIYGPSYISFESALSVHGWIPEAVYTTCSATVKQSKNFKTSLGAFSYEKIPEGIFSIGISHRKNENSIYFLADPWKALADLIYSRKKDWPNLEGLSNDLRIEYETMKISNLEVLSTVTKSYPNKRTRNVLATIEKEVKKI